MMKTRFLGLAIAMVALAVLVNVLALSSATVDSNMTVNVVNTSTALIAMSVPATPDSDLTVSTGSGVLTVTFEDGVQPQSSYTFEPVFTITNNSDDNVTINVTTTGQPAGMTFTLTDSSDTALGPAFSLVAGASVDVKMVLANTGAVTIQNHSVTITVAATKV